MDTKKRKISFIINRWLLIIFAVACTFSGILTYFLLSGRSEKQTLDLIKRNVEDASIDVSDMAKESVNAVLDSYVTTEGSDTANIDDPLKYHESLESAFKNSGYMLSVVNSDGIIVSSSDGDYIGYDIKTDERFSDFMSLINGDDVYMILDAAPKELDDEAFTMYAGVPFQDGSGFLMLGMTDEIFMENIAMQAEYVATNRRIGINGYLLVADYNQSIINSFHNQNVGKKLSDSGIRIEPEKVYSYVSDKTDVFGISSYIVINEIRGFYIVGVYPVEEMVSDINTVVLFSIVLEVIIFAVLFFVLIFLMRRTVIDNIVRINDSLTEITAGNLEKKVEVRDTREFDNLSNDINDTVDKLKEYISEAERRIDADLAVAKAIQLSVLPARMPVSNEFDMIDLFADTRAAREVGGDFYDYYKLGENKIGFVIADVSGKSIPGAMFMMRAKTMIKNLVLSGVPVNEIMTTANENLCEGNDADMFVTVWMGILDLTTGIVHAANAGHNPPVLIRGNKPEFVMLKPGLMIGTFEGIKYAEQQVAMEAGDILFLYTDGVTEAMNADHELYGEERLLKCLSEAVGNDPDNAANTAGDICRKVTEDLDAFCGGAEQSDDITMLVLKYSGPGK